MRELIPEKGVSRGQPEDPDHGLAGRLVVLKKIQPFHCRICLVGVVMHLALKLEALRVCFLLSL